MGPVSSTAEVVSDWILAAASAAGTLLIGLGGVVRGNYKRSTKNERRLEGDPDDPNHEGLLEIADDTREKVDKLEDKMDRQHETVLERVEELGDD